MSYRRSVARSTRRAIHTCSSPKAPAYENCSAPAHASGEASASGTSEAGSPPAQNAAKSGNGPRSVPGTGHLEKGELALSLLEGGAPFPTALFYCHENIMKGHFSTSPDVTARNLPVSDSMLSSLQIRCVSPVAHERWEDGLLSPTPRASPPELGCGVRANISPPAFPWDPRTFQISTPTPRCPTAGTSAIVAMSPLARALPAWLARASSSRWLIRTTRLGYAIQFAKRPPKSRVCIHQGQPPVRPCLTRGDCCPPGEGCNRAAPSSRDGERVLQPTLHRAQKERWATANPRSARFEPLSTQAAVQNAHAEAHPPVHSSSGLVCSIRPDGRVFPCLHSSSPPSVTAVAFEGRAWQYKALPFGLSLSPRVLTKPAEGALAPLRLAGIYILKFLTSG
ncbi:uncharacterized protein [Danio rerio]|uniref:Uncharacterized protein n=1 Tax=Danio rerio TaxID=7955 RepID=A0AC58H9M1_DANRE